MSEHTIKGKVAVVGVGETTYYKRGQSPDPEFRMAVEAILKAVDDAGLSVDEVDGFASYSEDRNDASRLASALGLKELNFSNMAWGGGGGMVAAAVGNAAAAIHAGYADCVVVFRALAQGQFGRFGQAPPINQIFGEFAYSMPYGLMSPAQMFAMKAQRFMYDNNVSQDALKAVSLASYEHAQHNPRAVMHGKPLTSEKYDESRWIVEPFHLYDCCQENDCAAALVLVSAERAKELNKHKPAYIWAAAQGSDYRHAAPVHNAPDYGTSNFKSLAKNLYAQAGISPSDIDVVQSYENFTGGVVMSVVEHGLCKPEEVNEFFTPENLNYKTGRLPLNTSGGNLAECYVHGMGLVVEGVRQVRGDSTCQVDNVEFSQVHGGPMVTPVSTILFSPYEA